MAESRRGPDLSVGPLGDQTDGGRHPAVEQRLAPGPHRLVDGRRGRVARRQLPEQQTAVLPVTLSDGGQAAPGRAVVWRASSGSGVSGPQLYELAMVVEGRVIGLAEAVTTV